MKKRVISTICIVLAMVTCIYVGAFAASNLEQIQAYLNYGITIKLDGQPKNMYDTKGARVYPISYKGTTYVPIRAVADLLDVDVGWDGPTNSVLLGKTGIEDFIENFEPYDGYNISKHSTISAGRTVDIAGKTYDHYIGGSTLSGASYKLYYDLGGKYETLTFQAYSSTEANIFFYGDNNQLIKKITVPAKDLPQTYTVDISNVQQFLIDGSYAYMFNVTIE